jgi:multidrug efflux pump
VLSKFFAHRPIFAWVIAIVVMAAGGFSITTMAVEQYPDIAPPTVSINASYNGADAQTIENSVTQVLEQQLKGIDGLLYFTSSSSNGSAQITVTFEKGINPDTAQVQVQNAIARGVTRLPQIVQQLGVNVNKAQADQLMVVSLYDSTGRSDNADIADYLATHFQDPISRVEGVGSADIFGSQYAMRIWLDPNRLNAVKLMPADVISALQAQNTQVSAGEIGALPSQPGQRLNATVTARSRLQTIDQFKAVVLKTQADGSTVTLGDVARVEMGLENYGSINKFNGAPATGLAINLASGANAMATARLVKEKVAELSTELPEGYAVAYPRDSSTFVKISIEEVVWTLIEAIGLVVVVMFVFLQNWRATLIPAIAVPVVLLGTFGILAAVGYSVNTLTMFGLVLAIGLLVDDAIVVVENVERVMHEEHLPPLEATVKSMGEITSALIGITLVLTAVFIPMAFFGGSTGVIYRQFSVTIVSAMALSVMVALTLTPALCATLLKEHEKPRGWFFAVQPQLRKAGRRLSQPAAAGGEPASGHAGVRRRLPGHGAALCAAAHQLPAGRGSGQPFAQLHAARRIDHRTDASRGRPAFGLHQPHGKPQHPGRVHRGGPRTGRQRAEHRPGLHPAQAVGRTGGQRKQRLRHRATHQQAFRLARWADFVLSPPAIRGLGNASGFEMWLQDAEGQGTAALTAARKDLLAQAADEPRLGQVRFNGLEDTPQLKVKVDDAALTAFQITPANVNSTLSTAWGGTYVNDFIDRGRVKRVYVQGDAPFRSQPSDLSQWFVRTANGDMAPFSAFAETSWTIGAPILRRFNGISAQQVQGAPGPGTSSGDAMNVIEKMASQLDGGFTVAWSGLSYQERRSSSQAPVLYAVSIFFIFLCLAALYESWSVPFSVMLVIPLGVIGAVLAVTLRGFDNDIYFQVALLTTIGLSAKNAILIVEFAEAALRSGVPPLEAALEAARLRFRPIIMTSVAFIAGVIPLVIASGAGANGRRAIGTGVMGGMLSATALAIFLVPLFFVLVKRWFARKAATTPAPASGQEAGA